MRERTYQCSDCGGDYPEPPYYTVDEDREEYLCPGCAGPYLDPDNPDDERRPEVGDSSPFVDLSTVTLERYIEWLINEAGRGQANAAYVVVDEILSIIARDMVAGLKHEAIEQAIIARARSHFETLLG